MSWLRNYRASAELSDCADLGGVMASAADSGGDPCPLDRTLGPTETETL